MSTYFALNKISELIKSASQVYTTVLSFISLISSTQYWRILTTRHVASLYVVAFIVDAVQTLRPTIVSGDIGSLNDDLDRGALGWARFALLAIVGAVIPLSMPQSFVASVSTCVS